MEKSETTNITKSDFLLYCSAPRHLWAKKHGRIDLTLSDFDLHLMDEGNKVEGIAMEYLEKVFLPLHPGYQLFWQQTFSDGAFDSRLDGLVYKPDTQTYELFEIKSSTGVDKDILYDVTFQALILDKHIPVDHLFVLHLNKEYVRSGNLDLSALLIAEDISENVNRTRQDVELMREEAFRVAWLDSFEDADHCLSPKDCPCQYLCHPDLPEFPIYDIPRLLAPKKQELLQMGILEAKDIPADFPLNPKQRLVAELARTGKIHIDKKAIASEMDQISYPVYFLDYETCISAIPLFEGYHPQQQIVFQYSLHKLESRHAPLEHFEHISPPGGDPALPLLESLRKEIGAIGSIIVWNKTFEMSRNREMALLYPEFSAFLEGLNNRIYDLGDIVNKGYYLHPGFKGSWSIKNVLPVMVDDLSYKDLAINKGDQASMVWWNITFGQLDDLEKEQLREELLRYCELDTRAMVEIFNKFHELLK